MAALVTFPNPVNEVAARTVAAGVLVLITVAATLESVFAFCVGCRIFAGLMRLGVVLAETCAACSDIALPYTTAS